ncbi:MAG: hypothetical protein AAB420_00280 [Patescibacteria group bacterium]
MEKENLKNSLSKKRRVSLMVLFLLVVIISTSYITSYVIKQGHKFDLLYQYEVIPDIELKNTLLETQNGLIGEIRGFVKFDNVADQPSNSRQYYILQTLNKFDENSHQHFSLEEVIKMQYLSPRSLGVSELVEVSKTGNTITLEDENGNKFFIDKLTKYVSMRDTNGDSASLITDDGGYRDFVEGWLK